MLSPNKSPKLFVLSRFYNNYTIFTVTKLYFFPLKYENTDN